MKNSITTLSLLSILAATSAPGVYRNQADEIDFVDYARNRPVSKQLAKNKSREWITIKNNAETREASIYIYDEISWFGILAEDVLEQIQSLDVDVINVHINSPGGSVFEGIAIYNLLKNHKAKVVTKNDGIAASIASVIMLAGDEIEMSEAALFMVHDPSSIVWGTAEDMRKEAEVLDAIKSTIVGVYTSKTGMKEEEARQLMADETWLDAAACLDKGFIDSTFEGSKAAASASLSKFDVSDFSNVPKLPEPKNKSPKPTVPKGPEAKETPSLALLKLQAEALELNAR